VSFFYFFLRPRPRLPTPKGKKKSSSFFFFFLFLPSRRSQKENALAVIPFMVRPVQALEQASGLEM